MRIMCADSNVGCCCFQSFCFGFVVCGVQAGCEADFAFSAFYRLVGLVVKASTSRAEGPGFESRLRRDFFGVESYQ